MNGLRVRERRSPNHSDRGATPCVDMLVLHYTGMKSAAAALDRLCDPAARVSAHYLVEEDGGVWRLVAEGRRAFHAGISCWAGERDLNRVSIGVEIANPGHEWGYRPFPEPQMQAVKRLCRDILSRHPIPSHRIVGHSDIAPDRKSDPGELFDWASLARAGIGLWPEPGARPSTAPVDRAAAIAGLGLIGYYLTPAIETAVVSAFQRRFRPARCDGVLDPETAGRIVEVAAAFLDAARVWGGVLPA
ncbi:MAG TPA: N-acetylmuramoyl-L-alanine amidase [Stellaceae bacterium]|nr:N-acetylmuramoyl-L-alanine amidase [Stellaceae bacterium]